MADPLRAALRVARAQLTDEGLRALAHAMLDAALAELTDAPRAPARRPVPPSANDAVPVDDLTAARAKAAAARLLG